jgi:hypothetical protein
MVFKMGSRGFYNQGIRLKWRGKHICIEAFILNIFLKKKKDCYLDRRQHAPVNPSCLLLTRRNFFCRLYARLSLRMPPTLISQLKVASSVYLCWQQSHQHWEWQPRGHHKGNSFAGSLKIDHNLSIYDTTPVLNFHRNYHHQPSYPAKAYVNTTQMVFSNNKVTTTEPVATTNGNWAFK